MKLILEPLINQVKETLINNFGWVPTEWRVRDLTKDSKKQNLPLEKRQNTTLRWLKETSEGKFKKLRVEGALKDFKIKNFVVVNLKTQMIV